MYRAASSRIRSLKGHVRNKTVSRFASTSAKSSSGGLFSWFTGGSSWRLPPVDFPLKGIELPSSLPDDVETKTTTLPNHSLDREIVGQQVFPSFLVALLGGGGSFSRLFSEVVGTKNQCELVLDGGFKVPSSGGFDAPDINAFGHTFRNYDVESERKKQVEELYKMNHINQTYDFVKRMREEYKRLDKLEMSIWECCELLNEVVDDSDLDLDEPQIEHLLQSAEAIRKDYPNEDWLHLTALIHDLGKVLLLPIFGELPQWAVVGDTHPLGCAFDESIVHHKYFKENPDSNNPAYQTKNGIYPEGCGLDNVMISWGHDDYMYLVAKENGTTLPQAGLFIIRYHSFYPLHSAGAYNHLMNEEDVENLKWLQIFNKYDLYSKSKVRVDIEKVKPYYQSLIAKYFPEKLRW